MEQLHDVRHDLLAVAANFPDELYSRKLAEQHFWLGTIAILLYILPIYWAGITQG
ncbi:MAG: hypothetical protein R3C12_16445 [Planctomycetaceae bacterium]